MNVITSICLKIGLGIMAIGAVFIGRKVFHVKDDSAFEELVEYEIKEEVGIEVDLTSSSPENPSPEEIENLRKIEGVADQVKQFAEAQG